MARRRSRRRSSRRSFTIPMAVVAGLIPPASNAWAAAASQTGASGSDRLRAVGSSLIRDFTGWDTYSKRWSAFYLKEGAVPVALGIMVHRFIGGSLGVNRYLAKAGIPFVRI